jgi:Tfp pilus assembly protein PilO
MEHDAMTALALPQIPRLLESAKQFFLRARRTLAREAQRVGPFGIVGAALLAFSLVFVLSADVPLHRELQRQEGELARKQAASHDGRHAGKAGSRAMTVLDFVDQLPPRGDLPSITQRIVDEAGEAGLELERGTYGATVSGSGRIVRARLSFPVTGSYPEIREFVSQSLAKIPSGAVDSLRLERKSVGTTEIDAEVSFAVYLRNGT